MTMNVDDQSKKGENLLPMAVVMGDGTSMVRSSTLDCVTMTSSVLNEKTLNKYPVNLR